MEGVSHEAASLAGHLGLGNLCASTTTTTSRSTATRRSPTTTTCRCASRPTAGTSRTWARWPTTSTGWRPRIRRAMAVTDKPSLLVLRSHIGYPSPDHTDDHEAHGNPFTPEDVTRTKAVMGIPDEPFWAPADVVEPTAGRRRRPRRRGPRGVGEAPRRRRPRPRGVGRGWNGGAIEGWKDELPTFEQGESLATRQAIQKAFIAALPACPASPRAPPTSPATPGRRSPPTTCRARTTRAGARSTTASASTRWGRPSSAWPATAGSCRPAARSSCSSTTCARRCASPSLSKAKALFVFTHDSVGVGEDGPTHQPVEQLAMLRAIPGLQVIRPADANETVAALRRRGRARRADGARAQPPVDHDGHRRFGGRPRRRRRARPSRASPTWCSSPPAARSRCASRPPRRWTTTAWWPRWCRCRRGIASPSSPPTTRTRCCPSGVPVLSVEAATTFGWERYADDSIGIDRFGASAPGGVGARPPRHQRRPRRRPGHRARQTDLRSPARPPRPKEVTRWIVLSVSTRSSARAPGSTT